jgi:hypothetical protein
LGPSAAARFLGPFDKEDSVACGLQSKFVKFAGTVDTEQVDMPDWRFQLLVWLDDRKAGARHFALMAQRIEEASRQCGLPNTKRTGERDHITGTRSVREARTELFRMLLVSEDHFVPRGMVRVTVVPFPFFDSSSTVPPWASMN